MLVGAHVRDVCVVVVPDEAPVADRPEQGSVGDERGHTEVVVHHRQQPGEVAQQVLAELRIGAVERAHQELPFVDRQGKALVVADRRLDVEVVEGEARVDPGLTAHMRTHHDARVPGQMWAEDAGPRHPGVVPGPGPPDDGPGRR